MNKLLLIASIFLSPMAQADVNPEEIFGSIFDIIQDQINKDKQQDDDNDHNWTNNKVLLQNNGNKIILGRVFLDKETGVDSVQFPKCNQSPNSPVESLRFVVKRTDAYIDTIRVTFQNGQTHDFDIDETYEDGDKSGWLDLAGNSRCIKKIRVIGEAMSFEPPNWNNNSSNGHFDSDFTIGFDEPSVVTFIGLKD